MAREERPAGGLLLCLGLECLEQGFYVYCHSQRKWTIFQVMYCSDVFILSCYISILFIIVCSRFRLRICYDHHFCGAILHHYSSKSVQSYFGFSDHALHKSFPKPQCYSSLCFVCIHCCQLLLQRHLPVRAGRLALCVLEIVFWFCWVAQKEVTASRCLWCWNVISGCRTHLQLNSW